MIKRLSAFFIFIIAFINLYSQDHSEMIEGPFDTPQEVTETCITCHDGVPDEIMKTRHWNWLDFNSETGEQTGIGKQNLINNFCIAVPSNWPRCTSCHISYGWKDKSFDFNSPENIDCLVCHDQTGTYVKSPTGAGYPDSTVNLVKVAQSVGLPTRANCGNCHFNGGGGAGVKHGDLDESLLEPTEDMDIHMGGMGFQCTECHVTKNHEISGGRLTSKKDGEGIVACENCHDTDPHSNELLNKHCKTVACQTCHIPAFARTEPTIMYWDWSVAGEDKISTLDEYGKETYSKKKGAFKWEKNIVPEYYWYNGTANYYELGEVIDPGKPAELNKLNGKISDPNSKIYPFKVMRGKQPYDSKNNYIIIPKLFGENGYWKTFDWVKASEEGMKEVNLDFSGSVGFVETKMYWPINHTVMSSDNALKCTSCHGIGGEHKLNWKKLGYKDDPMKKGTRFSNGYIKQ